MKANRAIVDTPRWLCLMLSDMSHGCVVFLDNLSHRKWRKTFAYYQSVDSRSAQEADNEDEIAGVEGMSASFGDMHACVYGNPEETELGAT